MKYTEFVKKYNASSNKNVFLKKHIVKQYLPYELKIAEARDVVNKTCYREINGKREFHQDSPAFFAMFMAKVIMNYTDIEFEPGKDALDAFNMLSEAELLEPIVLSISKKEYDTFNTVLQMVKDDEMENYRSLAGFFDTKVESLDLVLNKLVEAAKAIEDQKE